MANAKRNIGADIIKALLDCKSAEEAHDLIVNNAEDLDALEKKLRRPGEESHRALVKTNAKLVKEIRDIADEVAQFNADWVEQDVQGFETSVSNINQSLREIARELSGEGGK